MICANTIETEICKYFQINPIVTKAFKLFDMDNDGQITKDELRKLVEKVGGSMTEGEAKGLIHQADKDGNESIDFSEFSKLWAAIKGEGEVSISTFPITCSKAKCSERQGNEPSPQRCYLPCWL